MYHLSRTQKSEDIKPKYTETSSCAYLCICNVVCLAFFFFCFTSTFRTQKKWRYKAEVGDLPFCAFVCSGETYTEVLKLHFS